MDGLYMNTRIDVCVEVNHTRKARGLGNGRRQYNPTQRSVASLSDITLTSPCHWSLPSRSLLMHPPLPPSSPLPPPPPRALQAPFFFKLATLRLLAPSTRRSSLRRSRRISFCVFILLFRELLELFSYVSFTLQRFARQSTEQQQSLPRRILWVEQRRDAIASASCGNTRGSSVSRVHNRGRLLVGHGAVQPRSQHHSRNTGFAPSFRFA
jgi:hypothetical protein